MGSNSLSSRSTGQKVQADDVNQYKTAITDDLYPRNSAGAIEDEAGDVGASGYQWKNFYFTGNLIKGGSVVDTSSTTENFQIVSGVEKSTSSYPDFLNVGAGSTELTIDASTDLDLIIDSVSVTVGTDIVVTGLTTAPSSNNTAKVDMTVPYANHTYSKTEGEFGATYINIGTTGSEITSLDGTVQAFGNGTEYFLAKIDTASTPNRLYAFERGVAGTDRATLQSGTTTLTLLSTNHVFLDQNGSTTYKTTTYPHMGEEEPASPASGDWWFDTEVKKWKKYSTEWEITDAIGLGYGICDSAEIKAVQPRDFSIAWENDYDVEIEYLSASTINVKIHKLNVAGTNLESYSPEGEIVDLSAAADRESGVSEAVSTLYYVYVKESGKVIFSDVCPRIKNHKMGLYHPQEYWRCVGSVYNDSSGDIVPFIYGDGYCEYIPNGTGAADAVNSDYILTSSINTTYTFYSSETIPPYAIKGIIAVSVDANLEASANVYFYTKKRGQTYGNPEVTTSGGDSGSGVSTIKGGFVYSQNGTFICRVSADNGYLNYKGYEVKY